MTFIPNFINCLKVDQNVPAVVGTLSMWARKHLWDEPLCL